MASFVQSMLKTAAMIVYLGALVSSVSALPNAGCTLPTQDSSQWKDPRTKMEAGLLTGGTVLNTLLKSKNCTDKDTKNIELLSLMVMDYQSPPAVAANNTNENGTVENGTVLNLDMTLAFSYLMEDIKQEMCNWIGECFSFLSCDAYLNLLSLEKALENRVVDEYIGSGLGIKWAGEALCGTKGLCTFKSLDNYQCVI